MQHVPLAVIYSSLMGKYLPCTVYMFLFIFILEAPISQKRVRTAAYVTCILSSFFGLKFSNAFVSLILSLDRLELESNFSLLLTTSFTYL